MISAYIGYKHNQNPSIPIGTPAHHTIGIVTGRVERVGKNILLKKIFYHATYMSWINGNGFEFQEGKCF